MVITFKEWVNKNNIKDSDALIFLDGLQPREESDWDADFIEIHKALNLNNKERKNK